MMDRVKEAIEYHLQTFEPQLSLYEGVTANLWPLTTDRFTIKKDEPLDAEYIISKALLIEGMALHVARSWENLVVEDMILLFAQDTETYCETFSYDLEPTITRNEAEAILIGKDYLDFKSFGNIIDFSKKHLVDVLNPFNQIPSAHQQLIDDLIIVRNHIAHRSRRSLRSYRNVLTKYGLQGDKKPGYFLLFVPGQENPEEITMWIRGEGKKRVFGLYIEALKSASESIVNYLESVV